MPVGSTTIRPMTLSRPWTQAAAVPARSGDGRRIELPALPADRLPSLGDLFTFMRDAELRFQTLRMRIIERTQTARGESVVESELVLRHPSDARVITTEPGRGTAGNYDLWISDGETVRTFSGPHKLGTQRPVRHVIRGLSGEDARDFPGSSLVYFPLTPLPMETLPDTFIHPAGYCQNVLSTGRCWISGTDVVGDRPVIVVECDHPRTIEMAADRPDFHIQVAVDRADGVILRLIETIGGEVTRRADAVEYSPDAPIPDSAFRFIFPSETTMMF
jgi:outer membrane lipoprotein-sorting protein